MSGTQWMVVFLWLVLCWFGYKSFDSWCNSKVREAEQRTLEASMKVQQDLVDAIAQIARRKMELQR